MAEEPKRSEKFVTFAKLEEMINNKIAELTRKKVRMVICGDERLAKRREKGRISTRVPVRINLVCCFLSPMFSVSGAG